MIHKLFFKPLTFNVKLPSVVLKPVDVTLNDVENALQYLLQSPQSTVFASGYQTFKAEVIEPEVIQTFCASFLTSIKSTSEINTWT